MFTPRGEAHLGPDLAVRSIRFQYPESLHENRSTETNHINRADFSELASQRFNRMKGKSLTDETRRSKNCVHSLQEIVSYKPFSELRSCRLSYLWVCLLFFIWPHSLLYVGIHVVKLKRPAEISLQFIYTQWIKEKNKNTMLSGYL